MAVAKKREDYLDIAKFVAIFLVVVHHVRDYAGDPSVYAGMAWLENVSSVSNVAVFFAISGYLSRGMMQRQEFPKLLSRVVIYLWPMVSVVLGGYWAENFLLYGKVIVPPIGWMRFLLSVGWFFGCLVVCEMATFGAYAVAKERPRVLIAGLAAAYVTIWLVPIGLCHALEMIPFYWFGMLVLPKLLAWRYWAITGIAALALHATACIAFGDFADCGLYYHYTTMHLLDFSWRGMLLLLARYAIGLAGACGGILGIKVLGRILPPVNRLSVLGTQTLGVFFVHMAILNVYFAWVGWTGGGMPGRLLLSLLVFAVSYGLVVLTHQIGWVNALLWNPLAPFVGRKAV